MSFGRWVLLGLYLGLFSLLLSASSLPPDNPTEQVRAYTRKIEFDYVNWTLDALRIKLEQFSLGAAEYLPEAQRKQVVLQYLDLVVQIQQNEARLGAVFADPSITNPAAASADLRARLDAQYQRRRQLGPLAESILQEQVSAVVAATGLSAAGQPLPPVMYHSTPLPLALIVSPRDVIRQDHNISLVADLPLEQQIALEERVDASLDVSSLVVGIGGVGVYPTMVMQTSDINWLTEVVAHEWIHNYLTFRPLGINYMTTPELRTMNETTASIAGKEIGRLVVERYYSELAPPPAPEPPPPAAGTTPIPETPPPQPVFDFRAEMRQTRVTVDAMLAEGRIEAAEAYMEERRAMFWEHGYQIRKLNQAYFAFYGAYADAPGGAAGEDPVGAAVRDLRRASPSLADFVRRISWMWSYEQLRKVVDSDS